MRFEATVFTKQSIDGKHITRTVRRGVESEKIVAKLAKRLIFVGGKFVRQKFVDGAIFRLAVAVISKSDGRKIRFRSLEFGFRISGCFIIAR